MSSRDDKGATASLTKGRFKIVPTFEQKLAPKPSLNARAETIKGGTKKDGTGTPRVRKQGERRENTPR